LDTKIADAIFQIDGGYKVTQLQMVDKNHNIKFPEGNSNPNVKASGLKLVPVYFSPRPLLLLGICFPDSNERYSMTMVLKINKR
jgi:hypothetical protein